MSIPRVGVGPSRKKHPRRSGWTVVTNLYQPRKKDGTADKRTAPKYGKHSLHVHKHGHKRWYIDNVLRLEKYIPKAARDHLIMEQMSGH